MSGSKEIYNIRKWVRATDALKQHSLKFDLSFFPLYLSLKKLQYLCKMHGYHQYFDFIHSKIVMVKKYFETKGKKGSCFIQGLRHLISK